MKRSIVVFLTILITSGSIWAQKVDIKTGLIAYYPFGQDLNDHSGNSHNPTSSENVLLDEQGHNSTDGGSSFNGTSSSIKLSETDMWSDSLSVSVWFKATTFDNTTQYESRHILHKSPDNNYARDYDVYTYTTTTGQNKAGFWFGESASDYIRVETKGSLKTGNWYHFAVTRANGTVKLYVNGVEDSVATYTFKPVNKNQPVKIGVSHVAYQAFDGLLDELRIYKKALSQCEISYLYDTLSFNINSKLLAYYPLGADLNDYSGNELNATSSGNVVMNAASNDGLSGASSFNGQSSYVNIPSASLWSDSLSVSVLFNAKAFDNTTQYESRHILHKSVDNNYARDYDVYTYTTTSGQNKAGFWFGESASEYIRVETKGSLKTDTWYHFAVTRANGTVRLYINGMADSVATYSFTPVNKNHPAKIGVSHVAYQAFDGLLDELRIYKKQLSPCEVDYLTTSFRSDDKTLGYDDLLESSSADVIFPNPAETAISIHTKGNVLSFEVYDFTGQNISQLAIDSNNTINISSLSKGIYIIRYTTAEGSRSEKFVKN